MKPRFDRFMNCPPPRSAYEPAARCENQGTTRLRSSLRSSFGGQAKLSVAVCIFVMSAVFYVVSITVSDIKKRRAIASDLVAEGIEALYDIRDQNRERFREKAAECWNTKPDSAITLEACDLKENKIGGENFEEKIFRLTANPATGQWELDEGVSKEPAPDIKHYLYDQHKDNYKTDLSPFYRQILIRHLELDGNKETADAMKFTSVVSYKTLFGMRRDSTALFLFK